MQIFSAVCLLIRENIIWYLLQFSKISLVTFCLGGKILTPVPRRLGVISECWPVANESWGTFWSGQVKYEFRKLSKCVDLIKCSLTFTNEHELTDTQKPHVEPTEFVSLYNESTRCGIRIQKEIWFPKLEKRRSEIYKIIYEC